MFLQHKNPVCVLVTPDIALRICRVILFLYKKTGHGYPFAKFMILGELALLHLVPKSVPRSCPPKSGTPLFFVAFLLMDTYVLIMLLCVIIVGLVNLLPYDVHNILNMSVH